MLKGQKDVIAMVFNRHVSCENDIFIANFTLFLHNTYLDGAQNRINLSLDIPPLPISSRES